MHYNYSKPACTLTHIPQTTAPHKKKKKKKKGQERARKLKALQTLKNYDFLLKPLTAKADVVIFITVG
jgi:hypothetical protein